MFYPLRIYLTTALSADPTLIGLLATRPDGAPAIYPFHQRNIVNPTYPFITIEHTGSAISNTKFIENDFANLYEGLRFAICVWDKLAVDNTEAIYSRIRDMLYGKSVSNQFFSSTKLIEKITRSDMFDNETAAYHYHSEWDTWVMESAAARQPIPG